MNNRASLRNLSGCPQFVVIGDDELEPDRASQPRLVDRRNAAVHGDDHLDALGAQRAQRVGVQAVALLDAVRNISTHCQLRVERAQHVPEDRGRHHSVDVVVAVDGDALSGTDRRADGPRRLDHSVHGARVAQVVELWLKKSVAQRTRGDGA